nr:glycine-rich protein [Nocardioides flavescens]
MAPSAPAAPPQTVSFAFTGGEQQWVVPAGVTSVQIVANGARGGIGRAPGARASATVPVTPGAVLYVEVGGDGLNGKFSNTETLPGGFNGGGSVPPAYGQGGSGGGASDVRTVPRLQGGASLPSRLVVAGGGGGTGQSVAQGSPGGGGSGNLDGTGPGAAGGAGPYGAGGAGATQTAPGAGGTASSPGRAGQLGLGGSGGGAPRGDSGGGGGGGLYGGGGGGSTAGGGGGSSGFAVGATNLSIATATGPASVTITWTPADPATAPAAPATAPETVIGKAPAAKVRAARKKTKVKVTFSSPSPGATYECSLDAKAFAPCTSPAKLKVGRGRHTFAVRAGLAGVVDPTPAAVRFEVKRKKRR